MIATPPDRVLEAFGAEGEPCLLYTSDAADGDLV